MEILRRIRCKLFGHGIYVERLTSVLGEVRTWKCCVCGKIIRKRITINGKHLYL